MIPVASAEAGGKVKWDKEVIPFYITLVYCFYFKIAACECYVDIRVTMMTNLLSRCHQIEGDQGRV